MNIYYNTQEQPDENNTKWFSYILCSRCIRLPEHLPSINRILSSMSELEVISVAIINSFCGISCEGRNVNKKKAVVELNIKTKVLYASSNSFESLYIFESSFVQTVYVVIPFVIEGSDPALLFRSRQLQVDTFISDDSARLLDKRNIMKNICILVRMVHIPTFEF